MKLITKKIGELQSGDVIAFEEGTARSKVVAVFPMPPAKWAIGTTSRRLPRVKVFWLPIGEFATKFAVMMADTNVTIEVSE